jgi:acyl carrier protein
MQTSDKDHRVIQVISTVFRNKGLEPPALTPDTVLDRSLGLESIDFAEVVVRLEREFNRDPFASGDVPAVRTIHDLARLYTA